MSAEKRQQLIDEGKLRPDGSRIEKCPVCGQQLPEDMTARALAEAEHAFVIADPVPLGVDTPNPEADR